VMYSRRLDKADVGRLEVTLSLDRRATAVDREGHLVTVGDGSTLPYDALLLTTGGRATRIRIPGADLPGVLYVRTLDDAGAIDRGGHRPNR
ncbi:MAG: FAD-dependent oxidoreductase, partial [Acetobacteraceae bacterium]